MTNILKKPDFLLILQSKFATIPEPSWRSPSRWSVWRSGRKSFRSRSWTPPTTPTSCAPSAGGRPRRNKGKKNGSTGWAFARGRCKIGLSFIAFSIISFSKFTCEGPVFKFSYSPDVDLWGILNSRRYFFFSFFNYFVSGNFYKIYLYFCTYERKIKLSFSRRFY